MRRPRGSGCTAQLGRRRPFIAAAAAVVVVTMALFGAARPLGQMLGDTAVPGGPAPAATAIAVASFWAMDFGINSMQVAVGETVILPAPPLHPYFNS